MTVVAPDTNQSAVGHQKTLMRPLRVRERTLADGSTGWSVDGSPTDAVSLAFLGYFDHGFDLVASGINYGANLGDDITYSGTVSPRRWRRSSTAARRSRSRRSTTSIPTSRWPPSRRRRVARNILEHGLSRGELLNVNVPAVSARGVRGVRGHPPGQARLPGPAPRAGRPARHPLLLDRWAAAVRPRRARHGLPRGRPSPRSRSRPIHLDLTGRSLLKRLRTWSWPLDEAAATDGELAPDRPEGEAEEARIADEQAGDRR